MKHAIIRLREERFALRDTLKDLRLGIGLNEIDRALMMRQTRREIRETDTAIELLTRVQSAASAAERAFLEAQQAARASRRNTETTLHA